MTAPDGARPAPRPRISWWAYVFCGLVVVGVILLGVRVYMKDIRPYSVAEFVGRWTDAADRPYIIRLDIAPNHNWTLVIDAPDGQTRCYGKATPAAQGISLNLHRDSKNERCGTERGSNLFAAPSKDRKTLDIVIAGRGHTLVRES